VTGYWATLHYVDKRNVTSVFGLYLNIETTFWVN
jgi:hypothetical protein